MSASQKTLATTPLLVFVLGWRSEGRRQLDNFMGSQFQGGRKLGKEAELEEDWRLGRSWDPLAASAERSLEDVGDHPLASFHAWSAQSGSQLDDFVGLWFQVGEPWARKSSFFSVPTLSRQSQAFIVSAFKICERTRWLIMQDDAAGEMGSARPWLGLAKDGHKLANPRPKNQPFDGSNHFRVIDQLASSLSRVINGRMLRFHFMSLLVDGRILRSAHKR